jgi:hypothetical protein
MDLNRQTCRYITNQDMSQPKYCCEPVTRGSYCALHAQICYLTPKEMKNDHELD